MDGNVVTFSLMISLMRLGSLAARAVSAVAITGIARKGRCISLDGDKSLISSHLSRKIVAQLMDNHSHDVDDMTSSLDGRRCNLGPIVRFAVN